jgi:maltose alpha-D-glucosyltransferase / alpha-amylase
MADVGVGKEMYSELRRDLGPQLPTFLQKQRWFGGKARRIKSADVTDVVPIRMLESQAFVLMIKVTYEDRAEESYAMPLLRAAGSAVNSELEASGLKLEPDESGAVVLIDALKNEQFLRSLFALIQEKASVPGEKGELRAFQTTAYPRLSPSTVDDLRPKPVGAEQSNSSIIYGHHLILKFFRRIQEGINPDLEIGKFLTEKTSFANVPPLAGSLEYFSRDGKQAVQGILQQFVPNEGDAWSFTLESLAPFYDAAAKHAAKHLSDGPGTEGDQRQRGESILEFTRASIDPYLAATEILARRTAEMHSALASEVRDPSFAPEPFTMEFQRSLERSIRELMTRVFAVLREKISTLPEEWRRKAADLAGQEPTIASRFQAALNQPIRAARTRIHGDYHLGQVLRTGSDFMIIDFEGEPARPIAERRMKRSPLQDVAGMLRSFHYAAFAPLLGENKMQAEDARKMSKWADAWNTCVADRFLAKYFETASAATFLPQSKEETQVILDLHLLEKAIYELGYELNNRPTWVGIPLQGISKLLSE